MTGRPRKAAAPKDAPPATRPRKRTEAQKAADARRRRTPAQRERDLDEQLAEGMPEDVFDPAYKAHQLHMAGTPWREAARQCGYPTPEAAVGAVSRYLQKAANAMGAQQQQMALQTQIDRYEAILKAWWEPGTHRDERAAGILLRTLERLDRVQRLTEGDVAITRETLVISADRDEYIRQLQQVVEERDAAKRASKAPAPE